MWNLSSTRGRSLALIMFSFRINISKNNALSASVRKFSMTPLCFKSHYDVLGVTPSATQGDIKAAYYKKSMQYHPDKNKGSEEASKRFRDITEAYEVLGNLRLRKLYDKGILHTAGPQYATEQHEMQHGEEKFYHSREHRSKPPSTGRTTIYNFDAWTNEHYGKSFARREAAKARYEEKLRRNLRDRTDIGNEILFFSGLILMFTFGTLALTNRNRFDIPLEANKDNVEASENDEKR